MNGRGVFLSTKMGRFIATLEPRLFLMFAVNVLDWDEHQLSISHVMSIVRGSVGTHRKRG